MTINEPPRFGRRLDDDERTSPRFGRRNFWKNLNLDKYSRGMGAIGLPGNLSSQSRFIRASFVKMNSVSKETENESVSQFFHILNSVDQHNKLYL